MTQLSYQLSRTAVAVLVVLAVLAVLASGLSGCGSSSPPPAKDPQDGADDEPRSPRLATPGDDDDDDDGLEVEGLRGRLDDAEIEAGIRPHASKLERCYTGKIGRRRYLGGQIELGFVIGSDGTVTSARMLKSDLGAWPMEMCMLEVSRAMTFARPRGGRQAEFTVPLSFKAQARVEAWNQARADSEVGPHLADLAACSKETGESAPGDLAITLYVGVRGQVQSTGFASASSDVPAAWADCAAARIMAWTLSDPRGQVTKTTFLYSP